MDIMLGPFSNLEGFHMACINTFLAYLVELYMEHHLFHAPVPVVEEYDSIEEYRFATSLWNS
jgi:hypothetical protein